MQGIRDQKGTRWDMDQGFGLWRQRMRALNSGPSSRKSGQSRDVGRTRHLELDLAGLSCLLEPRGRGGAQGERDPVP